MDTKQRFFLSIDPFSHRLPSQGSKSCHRFFWHWSAIKCIGILHWYHTLTIRFEKILKGEGSLVCVWISGTPHNFAEIVGLRIITIITRLGQPRKWKGKRMISAQHQIRGDFCYLGCVDDHWLLHFRELLMWNFSPFRVKYNFHFLISNVLPQNPLVKTKVQKTKYWGIYKDEKFKTCHDYWKHPLHVLCLSFLLFLFIFIGLDVFKFLRS